MSRLRVGKADERNLLGTIRTLDGLGVVPLNCTLVNQHFADHYLNCEWGLISRAGWVVVNGVHAWPRSHAGGGAPSGAPQTLATSA